MMKRILVVPDVHGRICWKEPVIKYLDDVDRVVFLGDYLDPYNDGDEEYHPDDVFKNWLDIIDLKQKHMNKVILLKGNHDQHYSSEVFRDLAGGSRMDKLNWNRNHEVFNDFKDLFQIAHLEEVKGIPYIFTHAGLTLYWLHKVNTDVWHLPDNKVSIADPDIIERINLLDTYEQGQDVLAIIGRLRSWFGEKTGSVLWADIEEHSTPDAPKAYGLNEVFQVFGHSRLNNEHDKIEFKNLAMIDSQQCFMIDEGRREKIISVKKYEESSL